MERDEMRKNEKGQHDGQHDSNNKKRPASSPVRFRFRGAPCRQSIISSILGACKSIVAGAIELESSGSGSHFFPRAFETKSVRRKSSYSFPNIFSTSICCDSDLWQWLMQIAMTLMQSNSTTSYAWRQAVPQTVGASAFSVRADCAAGCIFHWLDSFCFDSLSDVC